MAAAMRSSACPLPHGIDKHLHAPATGQPDLPGLFVADAKFQQARPAALHRLHGCLDHRTLDAATGHRTEEMAVAIDGEVAAFRARRGTPGADHRGQRRRLARGAPLAQGFNQGVVAGLH
jgi:hypothetical protein